jgi:hypothetical protein
MQDWIENEPATARFGTIHTQTRSRKPETRKSRARKSKAGNVKLQKRFKKVLNTMSQKPSLKFPAGCNGKAEVKAAYLFLDDEHATFTSILRPHHDATPERIREQPVVLIPQGTTGLNLTRPREVMSGASPLNLLQPVSSRETAARRESRDAAGPGPTPSPALAHATDPAGQPQRATPVVDNPCLCAPRMPAHDDHSADEAPEAGLPLLSSPDEESFPCGNS